MAKRDREAVMNENTEESAVRNENPFANPIRKLWGKSRDIGWGFPWVPQAIQFLVQLLILMVFCVLYCTIGIAFHCYSIFALLLRNACEERRGSDDLIGKSAYAMASGVYLILASPFAVIVFPFMALGWIWKRMSWAGLILYGLVVLDIVLISLNRDWSLQRVHAFWSQPIQCVMSHLK